MTDLTLGLRIRVNDDGSVQVLSQTSQGLRNVSASAQQASKSIDDTDKSLARAAVNALSLSDAARAAVAGLSIMSLYASAKNLINYADSLLMIDGRTKVATASTADYTLANAALVDISIKTHSVLESNATLFARTNKSIEAMGGSMRNTLAVNDVLAKGLKIANAGVAEQAALTRQFAQAAASGVLRGDEFNSVMENGSRVAYALADGLHVNIGALRSMAEAGLLTMDKVLPALLSQVGKINDEFTQIPISVAGAFTNLETRFGQYIHSANTAHSATTSLAGAVDTVADHLTPILDLLVMVGEAAVIALAIKGAGSVAAYIAAKQAAVAAEKAHSLAITENIQRNIASAQSTVNRLDVQLGYIRAQQASVVAEKTIVQSAIAASQATMNQARATLIATDAMIQSTSIMHIRRQALASMSAAETELNATTVQLTAIQQRQAVLSEQIAVSIGAQVLATKQLTRAQEEEALASTRAAANLRELLNPLNLLNVAFSGFMGWEFGSWLNQFSSVANYATERVGHFAKNIEKSNYELRVAKAVITGHWGAIDELTAAHERNLAAIDANTGGTIAWRKSLDKANLSEKDYKDLLLSIKAPQDTFKEKAGEITTAFNAGILTLKDYTTILGNLRSELDKVNASKLTDFDKEMAKVKDEIDKIKLSPIDYQAKKASEKFPVAEERDAVIAAYRELYAAQDEQKRKEKEIRDAKKETTAEIKSAAKEEQKALKFLQEQAQQLNLLKLPARDRTLETEITKNLNTVLGEAYDKTKNYTEAKQHLINEVIDNTRQIYAETEAIKLQAEAVKRVNAAQDEYLKQQQTLEDIALDTQLAAKDVAMAKELRSMGAANEYIKQRIDLEQKVRALQIANPTQSEQSIRDTVIAQQRVSDEIAKYTDTNTSKSAAWMESAFKKAAENIQDTFANMFESMLNSDAMDSIEKFAQNIKRTLNQAISQQLALDLQGLFGEHGSIINVFKSAMLFGVSLIASGLSKTAKAVTPSPAMSNTNTAITGTGAMAIADSFSRDRGFEYQSQTAIAFNKSLDYLSNSVMSISGQLVDWIGSLGKNLTSMSTTSQVASFFKPAAAAVGDTFSAIGAMYSSVTNYINSSITAITDFVGLTTKATAAMTASEHAMINAATAQAEGLNAGVGAAAAESAATTAMTKVTWALSVIKFGYDLFQIWGDNALELQKKIVNSMYAASDALLSASMPVILTPVGWGMAVAAAYLNVAGAVTDMISNGFSRENVGRLLFGPLGSMILPVRKPNAWMNNYNPEQQGQVFNYNPNAETYLATGNKSAYIGEQTAFGMLVISTHEASMSIDDMRNAFGPLLTTVKKVDDQLLASIMALDAQFGQAGKTMEYYNNQLRSYSGNEIGGFKMKQDLSSMNTGDMLTGVYNTITGHLAESGTVVGKGIKAWYDLLTSKFLTASQDNSIYVLNIVEQIASSLKSFLSYPLELVKLMQDSIKSVSMGGTPDSVVNEINQVIGAYTFVKNRIAALGMVGDQAAIDTGIAKFLTSINAIGFEVLDAGNNLLAYAVALKQTGSLTIDAVGFIAEANAKFASLKAQGLDNSAINAYFGSFGLMTKMFAEAGVAFKEADLDSAAKHLHDMAKASVEIAKNTIDHAIANEKLTNITRDAAIATLVKTGKIEEATVAEAEYGVSIQGATKDLLAQMGFIQQLGFVTGKTLGSMGVSAETWQAAARNVVNVFGDMETAMATFDSIAKTFLNPGEYAQYNLDTVNRGIANMQQNNPALSALTPETIRAALTTWGLDGFINQMAKGNGEIAKETLTYVQLVGQQIETQKALDATLEKTTEIETKVIDALSDGTAARQAAIVAEQQLTDARNRANEAAKQSALLAIELMRANGNTAGATAAERGAVLAGFDDKISEAMTAIEAAKTNLANYIVANTGPTRPTAEDALTLSISGDLNAAVQSPLDSFKSAIDLASSTLNTLVNNKQAQIDIYAAQDAQQAQAAATDKAKAVADERKGLQDQLDQLTKSNVELLEKQRSALDESNRGLFDQIQLATKAKAVADERKGLQDQLDQLTKSNVELLEKQRSALDESNRGLFDQIQLATKAKAVADERKGLQDQLDQLTKSNVELLEKQRSALDENNRGLFDQIQLATKAKAVADERKGLQDQYDQLVLTNAQLLEKQRSALDGSNRALFDQIQTVKSLAQALDSAKSKTSTAMSVLQKSVDAERKTITDTYNAGIKNTQDAVDRLTQSSSKLKDLSASLKGYLDRLSVAGNEAYERSFAQAQIAAAVQVAQTAGVGAITNQDALIKAIDVLGRPSDNLFGRAVDYERDMYRSAISIAELSTLTDAALTVDERQLKTLQASLDSDKKWYDSEMGRLDGILSRAQAQIDAVNGTTVAVVSVKTAIDALAVAINAQVGAQNVAGIHNPTYGNTTSYVTNGGIDSLYKELTSEIKANLLANVPVYDADTIANLASAFGYNVTDLTAAYNIPGFATGGEHGGGWRIVGENGPELEYTGPSRIFSNPQSQSLLDNGDLVVEIKELRAVIARQAEVLNQIKQSTANTATNTQKTADVLDNNTAGGGPMLVKAVS